MRNFGSRIADVFVLVYIGERNIITLHVPNYR